MYYGVVFGILDWISDIVYLNGIEFHNDSLKMACITFIIIQPIWYLFIYLIYVASHTKIETTKERLKYAAWGPFYALLQYLKLLSLNSRMHDIFIKRLNVVEGYKLLTLENCYKVMIFTEFFLETLPQIILQVTNNNIVGWNGAARFSFAISIILFVKDVTLLTMYIIRRFIDQTSNP